MKTGNASPVMQNRIAGLFRKASKHCIEHFVPSPLVYQSSKGIWRDQPFELKLGRFRGAFRNRGFVLRQTNESTSEQVPDFERSGHASRHSVGVSIIRAFRCGRKTQPAPSHL